MTLAIDAAIEALRNMDLDDELLEELKRRLPEVNNPVWSINDGTITVRLLGDQGKVLGESGDFSHVLSKVLEAVLEYGTDDGVETGKDGDLPYMQANVSFGSERLKPDFAYTDELDSLLEHTVTDALRHAMSKGGSPVGLLVAAAKNAGIFYQLQTTVHQY